MVLTTTSTEAEADILATLILTQKLAACVQVQPIHSHYRWQGEICSDPEFLLFIKTRTAHYQKLEDVIHKNHSYETPEIIQLPVTAGCKGYLKWIDEVTAS